MPGMTAGPTVSGSAGNCPTIATCLSARRRQPRSIRWIRNAITTTSTAAKISDPTRVPVFMSPAREEVSVANPGRGVEKVVLGGRHFPSRAVIVPRSSVAVTVAGRVIASNGVLADGSARSSPATVQVASGSTTVRLAGSPTSSGRP